MLHNRTIIIIGLIGILAGGCATVKTPRGYLPKAKEFEYEVFGGWMALIYHEKDSTRFAATGGELIAVHNDSVYLLGFDSLIIIPADNVERGVLVLFKKETGKYALWSSIGLISSVSNGVFAIGTAPLWLIMGIITTVSESQAKNFRLYPQRSWVEIRKFSRFPQGIPEGLNLNQLKPKPF